MDRAAVAFDKVFVLGTVDPAVIPPCDDVVVLAADVVAGAGLLPVDAAVQWARSRKPRGRRALVLTDRDLFIPECASLFGFADVKARIALVSTARLMTDDPAQSRRRLENAIRHEAAHLDGLRHCRRDCLMQPATSAADLDDRPFDPCGRCPRAPSMMITLAVVVAMSWVAIIIAGRFIDRVPLRVRDAAAIPGAFTAAFAEVPWDPGEIYARPVIAISQDLARATVDGSKIATDLTLPPGLSATPLSQFAAITSVMFRTPNADPVVHVHVIELSADSPSLAGMLGCGPVTRGTAYDTCHVREGAADVHLVQARSSRRATVVFSPAATGREMAERLAAKVGTGGGLLRDEDMHIMLRSLPAQPPAGLVAETVIVSNVHRVPEATARLTGWILGPDYQPVVEELSGAAPLALAAARYRTADGGRAVLLIGDYGSRFTAWLGWRNIRQRLAPWDRGAALAAGVEARRVESGPVSGLVFRKGQYLVAVLGDGNAATTALLEALAAAAQL